MTARRPSAAVVAARSAELLDLWRPVVSFDPVTGEATRARPGRGEISTAEYLRLMLGEDDDEGEGGK